MRSATILFVLIPLAPDALGQGFAGPQPREAGTRAPDLPLGLLAGFGPVDPGPFDGVSPLGPVLPTPLGLSSPNLGTAVLAARVFAPGQPIQIPGSADGTAVRMVVVPNSEGGQSTILYDPGTGSIVEYVQNLQVGTVIQGPDPGPGVGAIFQSGINSYGALAGYRNVTIDPATGTYLPFGGGIPAINNLTPSYDFRANAPMNFGGTPGTAAPGVGDAGSLQVGSPGGVP